MTADIDSYFNNIRAQIKRVPRDLALAVGEKIFQAVVHKTRQDSGQAALNWFYEPYESDAPTMRTQEMLWGYGKQSPVSPAGYKRAHGVNSDQVFIYQFEYMVNQSSLAPENLGGILIYNPITPGFPDFAPGNDTHYAQTALGAVDIDAIAQAALAEVEGEYNGN